MTPQKILPNQKWLKDQLQSVILIEQLIAEKCYQSILHTEYRIVT